MKNFYSILEIEKNATLDEIKKSYRLLALKYHPDRSGNEYKEKFQEISEAYSILSDKENRKIYDNLLKKYRNINILVNKDINISIDISLVEINNGIDRIIYVKKNNGTKEAVHILCKPGIENNTILKFFGYGEYDNKEVKPGNLNVTIKYDDSSTPFKIKIDNNLSTFIKIDYLTACIGGIKYIDSYMPNEIIKFTIPENILDGSIIESDNDCGILNRYGIRGKVFATIKLVPPNISRKKKQALEYIVSYVEPEEMVYELCSVKNNDKLKNIDFDKTP